MPDPWQRVRAVLSALPDDPHAAEAARTLRSRGMIPAGSPDFGEGGAVVIGAWAAGAPLRALELYRRQVGASAEAAELTVAAALIADKPADLQASVTAITRTDGARIAGVMSGDLEDQHLLQAIRALAAREIRMVQPLSEFPI